MSDPERWLVNGEGGSEMTEMLRAAKGMSPTITEKVALGARLDVATTGLWMTPAIKAIGVGAIVVGAALGIREASQDPPQLSFTEESAPQVSAATPRVITPGSFDEPATQVTRVSFGEAEIETPRQLLHSKHTVSKKSAPPSEATLLKEARARLVSDPASALRLLGQHKRLYPSGALSQERELLKVRALHASGNSSAARTQEKEFRKKHPDSVHHVPGTTR